MFRKRVITMSSNVLHNEAQALLDTAAADGFVPDLVVGIAAGGLRVAECLHLGPPVHLMSCSLRRPSSAAKQRWAADRLLRSLPYAVSDRLRLLEDRMYENRPAPASAATPTLIDEARAIARDVRVHGHERLLLIDDALDSGATLACVESALRAVLPERTELRTAVLTATRPPAVRYVQPDYRLYEEVLVRFPWSYDYRGRDRVR